jgi:hypothetical protein
VVGPAAADAAFAVRSPRSGPRRFAVQSVASDGTTHPGASAAGMRASPRGRDPRRGRRSSACARAARGSGVMAYLPPWLPSKSSRCPW